MNVRLRYWIDKAILLYINEVTIRTLPHVKCIKLVSVRSILPCINIGVRIELDHILIFGWLGMAP